MKLEERFIKYIGFDTKSDDYSTSYPSTPSQLLFADLMVSDLKDIGILNAHKDEFGLVYASLNNGSKKTIGLIAHMDTSPALDGGIKRPKIIKEYDGNLIDLNGKYFLRKEIFPCLNDVIGDDLIVTDGEHLLGGDDKAGIAIIFEFAKYYVDHKNEFNFNLAICFTPDEEVGAGWKHFDVKKINADFAYTLDGESIYEVNHENFNAASATIKIIGNSIHPGSAKNIMVNAGAIGAYFQSLLPSDMTPETTCDYEGFIHLTAIKGDVENCTLEYILRDHNLEYLELKKQIIKKAKEDTLRKYPKASIEVTIKDEYKNMSEYFKAHPEGIELINKAYLALGLKLVHTPIRGGTDGAMITYMGLPCPNLGTGDYNPHGRFEFVSITQMYKMIEILKSLFKLGE